MDAFQHLPFTSPFQQPQAQAAPVPTLAFPEVTQQPAPVAPRPLHPDVVPDLPERQEEAQEDYQGSDVGQAEAFMPAKLNRGKQRGRQVREQWGPVRTRLDRMAVGDCEAFPVESGSERSVYQSANERWVKDAGKAFTVTTGLFVMSTHNTVVLVLATRTA